MMILATAQEFGQKGRRLRRWQLLNLLVATLLLASCTARPLHARPDHMFFDDGGAVIPDTGGPIAEIALQYLPELAEDLAPTYGDLFAALPPEVKLEVVCPSTAAVDQFLSQWGPVASAGGRKLEVVDVARPVTIWARDRRIARQSVRSPGLARPFVPAPAADYREDKNNELEIPRLLFRKGLIPAPVENGLHIEGGNIVSNERHVFIGANAIEENLAAFAYGVGLDQELLALFGRDYVVVADDCGQVPWCHVDMYVAPVDEENLLVASPTLAQMLFCISASGVDPDVEVSLSPFPEVLHADASLNAIATDLAERGYEVGRLPAVIDPNEEWMITYTNVLMEHRGDRRIVYMPIYRIPVLDEAAASIYSCLGFEVRTIDVSGIYRNGGAIRCLANVTARRPRAGATAGEKRADTRANRLPPGCTRCKRIRGHVSVENFAVAERAATGELSTWVSLLLTRSQRQERAGETEEFNR